MFNVKNYSVNRGYWKYVNKIRNTIEKDQSESELPMYYYWYIKIHKRLFK